MKKILAIFAFIFSVIVFSGCVSTKAPSTKNEIKIFDTNYMTICEYIIEENEDGNYKLKEQRCHSFNKEERTHLFESREGLKKTCLELKSGKFREPNSISNFNFNFRSKFESRNFPKEIEDILTNKKYLIEIRGSLKCSTYNYYYDYGYADLSNINGRQVLNFFVYRNFSPDEGGKELFIMHYIGEKEKDNRFIMTKINSYRISETSPFYKTLQCQFKDILNNKLPPPKKTSSQVQPIIEKKSFIDLYTKQNFILENRGYEVTNYEYD